MTWFYRIGCGAVLATLMVTPALAQVPNRNGNMETGAAALPPSAAPLIPSGQTAMTGSGQIGRRQARTEAAPSIQPVGRIDSRINTRVQSRIRNRIDRFYEPRTSATSALHLASEEAVTPGTERPR